MGRQSQTRPGRTRSKAPTTGGKLLWNAKLLAHGILVGQQEIARLRNEIGQRQRRIEELEAWITSSQVVAGARVSTRPAAATLSFAQLVRAILTGMPRPMRLVELLDALPGSGRAMGGATRKKQRVNLLQVLRRMPDVMRVGRGAYALSAQAGGPVSVSA